MEFGIYRYGDRGGIRDNLADKTKQLGIPVWKFGGA
jgi:hypothetical protein